MRYEERQLSHAGDWLECGWVAETRDAVPGHRVLPDGCVDVVYDHAGGLRIVGAMTRAQFFDVPAGIWVAGLRLRPGSAGSFFRCSAAEFTDLSVPLKGVSQLDNAGSPLEALAIIASLVRAERRTTPIQRAIDAMTRSNGRLDLAHVACQANLSVRQFRRRCAEESGLSPARLNRILRFRRAAQLASERRNPNWSGIAAEAGYFDQAHFIRDCREFAGHPPMAVFSKTADVSGG